MDLLTVCAVFVLTAVAGRFYLRHAARWQLYPALLLVVGLAWVLYPALHSGLLPYWPRRGGMPCYAALVGLQLGWSDAAIKTLLSRLRRQA